MSEIKAENLGRAGHGFGYREGFEAGLEEAAKLIDAQAYHLSLFKSKDIFDRVDEARFLAEKIRALKAPIPRGEE